MSVLSKDEFFARLEERFKDDVSDESIKFIEDMSDTYTDLEARANGDGEDWKQKYDELNAQWSKRYRDRFFSGATGVPNSSENTEYKDTYNPEDIQIENLFTDKGGAK